MICSKDLVHDPRKFCVLNLCFKRFGASRRLKKNRSEAASIPWRHLQVRSRPAGIENLLKQGKKFTR